MKNISIVVMALCLVSFLQLTYADSLEIVEPATGVKCLNMANADFSLSYLDTNKDGNISKEEYLSGDKNNTEKTFKHLDANNDGQLDKSEQKEIEAVYKSIHDQCKLKSTAI